MGRHLPPSASRARLQMRTPLSDERMTWIAEWLLHEVADVTWGGEGQSVWKPCWQEIAHVRISLSWMFRLSRGDGGLGLRQLVASQLSGWSLAVDCFHSLLKSLFWSDQIDRAKCIVLYLIYLRIPQQGSNPDRGGLLSSYNRKIIKTHNHTHTRKEERNRKERKDAEEMSAHSSVRVMASCSSK